MERFARIIVGYHGCSEDFARKLLLGKQPIGDWKPSENRWDWLGKGIYFWEHSPERALRWAQERFRASSQNADSQVDTFLTPWWRDFGALKLWKDNVL